MVGVAEGDLVTARLVLVRITIPVVEAMLTGHRERAEAIVGARLPEAWPGRDLVERAFSASLKAIRSQPDVRLWGDRVMVTRQGARCVVGSVVFHGSPDPDGAVEMAYGVEGESQGRGFATEATEACLLWALGQPGVNVVRATTPPWHQGSRRVLEKIGMRLVCLAEHDLFGEVCRYERQTSR